MDIKEAVYRRAFCISLQEESEPVGSFYLGDTYDTREYIKDGSTAEDEKVNG